MPSGLSVALWTVGLFATAMSWGWDWFSSAPSSPRSPFPIDVTQVPFEELDPDERFLQEASKIAGIPLSQLDTCQQKIVMRLKSSCGSLNDEGLARLAVHLLNCQSSIEGRRTYHCTDDMSLKSCTSEMSPDVWNAYHIMSNRARAVCYSGRQQHFRAAAEMIVNKLVETTQTHLAAIDKFQEKQRLLQAEAEFTLERLSKNQRDVLLAFSKIRAAETSLVATLGSGLEKAKEAESFIDDNYKLLTNLRTAFQDGIEKTGKQVEEQMVARKVEQAKLMKELLELKKLVLNIRSKIDDTSSDYDATNEKMMKNYKSAFERLDGINAQLDDMLNWAQNARNALGAVYNGVEQLIGPDGEKLVATGHLLALVLAMILASFLSSPVYFRWLLTFGALCNLYAASVYDVKGEKSLLWFYVIILFLALVDYAVRMLLAFKNRTVGSINKVHSQDNIPKKTLNPIVEEDEKSLSKVDAWLTGKYNFQEKHRNGVEHFLTPRGPMDKYEDNASSIASSLRKRPTRPSTTHSMASSGKTMCIAMTKNGTSCRNQVTTHNSFCRIHAK